MIKAILIIWMSMAPGSSVQSVTHLWAHQCDAVMAVLDDPARRPDWVRQWQTTGAILRIACVEEG